MPLLVLPVFLHENHFCRAKWLISIGVWLMQDVADCLAVEIDLMSVSMSILLIAQMFKLSIGFKSNRDPKQRESRKVVTNTSGNINAKVTYRYMNYIL